MTTYSPQAGVHVGRPPCATCGANYHLHRAGTCPAAYRPDSLQAAVSALSAAQGRHDPAATFAARGDLQRLLGRAHTWDGCIGCQALDPDHTEAP